MEKFKFVCRHNELAYAKNALTSNDFVVYYYFDNSGISHFLKKLRIDICTDGKICFYIDCARSESCIAMLSERALSIY